ncbi:BZ3500_MvSof-1268-A1-R1_Chr5-2g08006 [Microbotryum saponariae]|uniref:V-type proton ATPase subunit F n=1 Tax=Microbotryum saponariae TaxID=289078 RepID=A0A2X0M9I7_9BASI|nr:BZ3500_MvSof-1268-A1-R1_Chr5-2g08006 [Microbotryum saponariae]SDA05875.1 BZ3501_MvSof-1269-A2-R1_Chr5-2g07828 [Microbotryum saponariae]
MASHHQFKDRSLIATIGDEDTITGLLLAGTGHVDARGKKNFMVVTSSAFVPLAVLTFAVIRPRRPPCSLYRFVLHSRLASTGQDQTPVATIESAFAEYTDRSDIAIVLINQHIADQIRALVEKYERAFPALLEIPSKDHPYDPSKDSVLKRVKKLFGE